jgi:8-oxo-dGTP pyrophosphatase MutT (NUDIX family)
VPPAFVRVVLSDREGRLLLLQRAAGDRRYPGLWEFPGGGIDPGETPPQAAARELREEVGLESPPLSDWGSYGDDTAFYRADCDAAHCAPTLSREHDAWCWAADRHDLPPLTPSAGWAVARIG